MALVAGASARADGTPGIDSLAAGRRIYMEGVLPSGERLRARVQDDVAAEGSQLVCAGCHGRSGMGVGEGQRIAPAVAGAALFQPNEIRQRQLYDTRTFRPAYTDATLEHAIRSGLDAAGRVLDPMMPRYNLNDTDARHLIAYLKALSSQPSPGVDAKDIHFATIVTDGVPTGDRAALLAVLETFFASKSAGTRHETSRAERGPFHMERHYRAYRKWNLHVWELHGPPQTWREQLDRHYSRQPVFAVIGGAGAGSWQEIHSFCEQQQLPCLLPNTDLPAISETDYYTVYFSKGIVLEAQVLARHLSHQAGAPVVQLYRRGERATRAATTLREALRARGITDVRDHPLAEGEPAGAALEALLRAKGQAAHLVLWLDGIDLKDAARLHVGSAVRDVYLSSTLSGTPLPDVAAQLGPQTYVVQLADLQQANSPRLRALESWMRSHGLTLDCEQLQANTLFAATLAAQALKHIGSNFYRDYFLERVEHVFDAIAVPSAYARPSLGPGQRYASKGGYVLRVSQESDGTLGSVREWLVP